MHHGKLSKTVAKGLLELKRRVEAANVPPSRLDESLNIATWNIREFGRRPRRAASLHYIAEILGVFDLIAVVELRDDLSQLREVLGYLGPYWDVVFSDYLTDAGGNRERIGFVYDRRAVEFTGLASYAIPQRKRTESDEYASQISWWRPPYLTSWRSGSFDFILLAAHIRWGKSDAGREPELRLLAEWVHTRTQEQYLGDKDLIVLGDFNIPAEHSPLFDAITSRGLRMPEALLGQPGSNLARNKRYDQILHDPRFVKSFSGHAGVLDFYCGDHRPLYPRMPMTKRQFTYELSDHLPLWVQINTDIEAERLDQLLARPL
ncbi:MAG: endonuclease/exonuclease/phosphatase family protein [Polyangiaceae bacterium]